MTKIRTHIHCSICGKKLTGRTDKKFCDYVCKNEYHRKRKAEHLPFSAPIDQILHRNWVILKEYSDQIGKKKFFISKADLSKSGFNTTYYTTTRKNKHGKIYHYIYNFGWMDFSEQQLMIVHLIKSK